MKIRPSHFCNKLFFFLIFSALYWNAYSICLSIYEGYQHLCGYWRHYANKNSEVNSLMKWISQVPQLMFHSTLQKHRINWLPYPLVWVSCSAKKGGLWLNFVSKNNWILFLFTCKKKSCPFKIKVKITFKISKIFGAQ